MDTNKFIYKSDETFWFASEAGSTPSISMTALDRESSLRWSSRC